LARRLQLGGQETGNVWVALKIQSSPKGKARKKFRRAAYEQYVSQKFIPQRSIWDEIWILRGTHA
jgi:hypothetical protein